MAEDASAVSSAAAPSYGWLEIPAAANYIPEWSSINQWHRSLRSSSSCDEDDSSVYNTTPFDTNACGHSALSMKSSSEFSGEPPENHLWNQAILNAAGRGDTFIHRIGGKSFLQMLHSKSAKADQLFDSAADFLKKQDSSWEHANPQPPSSLERQFANFYDSAGRLITSTSLSDLASNWSVSSPIPIPSTCGALTPSMARCSSSNVAHERQETGYQIGLNRISGALLPSCSSARSLPDFISFSGCSNRSTGDLRPSDLADSRRQGYVHSSGRGNGRCPGTAAGRKRRSSDNSETPVKKSKEENSAASSYQAPKVKVLDKINALQQHVSPFGKTDTASVLFETINCIKILQEQVQLLCDTYIRLVGSKVGCSWGEMERKEKSESMLDLRSKGLCLIPISCVPQVHQENCCPDYWMPAYPTCLYR